MFFQWNFNLALERVLGTLVFGYAPDDRAAFTQRVYAYALRHALDTLLIYQAEGNAKGLRYCQDQLQQ